MEKTEGTVERVGGYRVVRRLAIGGTSDVLLAKAEGPHGFERQVVLKLLLSQYKHDDDFKGMFAREAAAYARLSHPSIVRLYDFFSNDDQLVMVLEYIDGPSLSRLRGMLKSVGQQLDDATAIFVAGSVFDALAAAHAATDDSGEPAPVIHRDVNPTNVLIPWDGHVKLADFGIAKVTGASHQSSAGLVKGTYGYMAPEQVKGENVTPRADVYAGAIILWEMLTRRRAFTRGALPDIVVLRELAEPRIPSLDSLRPDLDKTVRDVIRRALEPRAEKRNITAEEMFSTLRSVVPSDEGRERLAKALASVRHEPKALNTGEPPPFDCAGDDQETAKLPPTGMLPREPGILPQMTPAPRPTAGVPRKTAAYGAPPPPVPTTTLPGTGGAPRPSSTGTPRPPVVGPPRPRLDRSATEVEPSTLTPDDLVPAAEEAPSSVRGLASMLEPSEREPITGAGDRENLRIRTPLSGIGVGKEIKDAIDEVLRDMPSNVPPDVFPKTDPPRGAPATSVRAERDQTLVTASGRELGKLPPAPAPLEMGVPAPIHDSSPADLVSTLVMDPGEKTSGSSGPRAMPSSFPAMNRTLSMNERTDLVMPTPLVPEPVERPTERPPPQITQAVTAPMPAVPSPLLAPLTEKMSAFVAPAVAVGSSPRPAPGTLSSSPGSAPAHLASSGSLSGAPAAGPASTPPQRRGTSVLALVAILFIAIGAGVAGTAGYVRWKKTHVLTAMPSAPPPKAVAPTLPTSQSPFAAPATSTAPAPASTPAPTSASASASATAAASAPATAEDLPPGTGRVKTTNAASGRRIFVDEKTVGQTPEAVVVKCGTRNVKLGSTGSTQTVDVPCGGEITVGDR